MNFSALHDFDSGFEIVNFKAKKKFDGLLDAVIYFHFPHPIIQIIQSPNQVTSELSTFTE